MPDGVGMDASGDGVGAVGMENERHIQSCALLFASGVCLGTSARTTRNGRVDASLDAEHGDYAA